MSNDLTWVVLFYVLAGYLGLCLSVLALGVLLAVLIFLLPVGKAHNAPTSRIH